jgi:hypothetical protein
VSVWAWQSFAALGVQDLTANITQDLVSMSIERVNEFDPTDLASLLRSMVLCGYSPSKENLKDVCYRAFMIAGTFGASATSIFLWSIAMLGGNVDMKLREEIKARIAACAASFSFYECGDIIWACNVLDIQIDPAVWSSMWKTALGGVTTCDGTSLSNIMFAHGTWRIKPEQVLLDAIKERITEIVPEFEPEEVGNLTWAMGALGCEAPEVLLQAQQDLGSKALAKKTPCYNVHSKETLISIRKLQKTPPSHKTRQELFV